MINNYLKYRSLIFVIFTFLIVFITFNSIDNLADSIEKSVDIVSNENQVESKLQFVSIPQGSSASEISNILDNEGIISSSLAFEIYH